MKIIDMVIARIGEHKHSSSSIYLAEALASACNSNYKVSLLDASVKLDGEAKGMIIDLVNIAQQPDYSNDDQDEALTWLRANNFIE